MEVNIDVEQIYLIIAVLLGCGGLSALVKRWIRNVVNELKTGNGMTLGQYIVKTDSKLESLNKKTDELTTCVKDLHRDFVDHKINDH